MATRVTDEQVAALRAQLADQPEEHKRLLRALDQTSLVTGYKALLVCAFCMAARLRCRGDDAAAKVIEFVAHVRSISAEFADKVDPRVAEQVILEALTGDTENGIAPLTTIQYQVVLLSALIADRKLDDARLDDFLAQARVRADRLLA